LKRANLRGGSEHDDLRSLEGHAGECTKDLVANRSRQKRVLRALSIRGREIECSVARDALEAHFWLPRDAGEMLTLRTFESGRNRIVAVAQRKLLARSDERLWLAANDSVTR
jgi:hypothetical protein